MKCSQPLARMPRACRKTSCRWGGAAWPSLASSAATQLCGRDTVKGGLQKRRAATLCSRSVPWWQGRNHQVPCFACVDLQGIIDYGEAHKHITATLRTLISQVCAVC